MYGTDFIDRYLFSGGGSVAELCKLSNKGMRQVQSTPILKY